MNIWKFQSNLTHRLLVWSYFSLFFAILLQIPHDRFFRGIGVQFAAWGLIDALIAFMGSRASKNRAAQLPDPNAADLRTNESRKLQKLLLAIAGLDLGYAQGGSALMHTNGKTDRGWRGHGFGVIIQSVFP
jgi:hypothetical protein